MDLKLEACIPEGSLKSWGSDDVGGHCREDHRALPILVLLLLLLMFRSILAACLNRIVRQGGNRRLGHVLRLLYKRLCYTGLLGLACALNLLSLCGQNGACLVTQWPGCCIW